MYSNLMLIIPSRLFKALFPFSYTLTGGILLSTENLPTVRFSLSSNDLNMLKSMTGLFTSINNTFLYFSANLIKDMNENFIEFIYPLMPSNILSDSTPPELEIFDLLDFNKRTVTLIFTEPVNVVAVNFTKIYLQVVTHYIMLF